MERAADRPPAFALTADATAHGSSIDVRATVSERGVVKRELDWRLVVALVATKARTSVTRGENAGETLTEASVVRALSDRTPIPLAQGSSTTIRLTKPADLSWSEIDVVGFVQSERTREIGAAMSLERRRIVIK
jgi:hypothetical protein